MILDSYTERDYADALQALLPPGRAWKWPVGGFGDSLLIALVQEFLRVSDARQAILDNAIETHRPIVDNWSIERYREVAAAAIAGTEETLPRKMFAVGAKVGDRLWSSAGPATTFAIDLFQVDHLLGPLRVGSKVGDRCWGTRARYVMRVRYYRSVVDPAALWEALSAFKQAHVYLWFEDITGVGGSYASN